MRLRRTTATLVAAAAVATGALAAAPAASATTPALGSNSLASVLLSDGNQFDNDQNDFDIVTEAALTVLGAKPDSAVGVLTDGTKAVTAFIPRDQAFRYLVYSLTGKWLTSEKAIFEAVAGLGVDTVEAVLLYHVVPGATVDRATALTADGASLGTALAGASITVDITPNRKVELIDADTTAVNPRVRWDLFDINKGNLQIAHGIDRVLRPIDLP